jgi:DNA-binding transcriptional LysR family regulator
MASVRTIDWAKLQSFVCVAEHGSLSAAARATGASQPTLSRHIAMLEQEIGVRLFDRTSEGLTLTTTGSDIYENARDMSLSADQISLIASGRSQEVSGTVRITASDTVACYSLPSMLTALRQAEPQIAIELVASNQTNNLLRREADIAVRMYRPTQNDVITRKVGELKLGFFASTDYLERRGRLARPEELLQHELIGHDLNDGLIQGFRKGGLAIDRDAFSFRSDAMYTHLEFVRAGWGIGLLHVDQALETPGLEVVLPDLPIPPLEFWLTAHAELKTSARIRRVYDFLADALLARYGS